MPREKFSSIDEIPDLVPGELLIPVNRTDLRVPREELRTPETTSPIEVGYVLFTSGGFFQPFKSSLTYHAHLGESSPEFLKRNWMNHAGRAVVRAALDPDRYAPIDMFAVYENEEESARFPNANEHDFFKHFAKTWGVLQTRE